MLDLDKPIMKLTALKKGLYYRARFQETLSLAELSHFYEEGRTSFQVLNEEGKDITEEILRKIRRFLTSRFKAESMEKAG